MRYKAIQLSCKVCDLLNDRVNTVALNAKGSDYYYSIIIIIIMYYPAANAVSRGSCVFSCRSVSIDNLLPSFKVWGSTPVLLLYYVSCNVVLFVCLFVCLFSILFCVFVLFCVVFVLAL
jgi:hypothetical protein